MRASGAIDRLAASSAVMTTRAAAPSLMPEALPAVTVPSLAEGRAQLGERFDRRIGFQVLVLIDDHIALAALDRDRRDLGLEAPGSSGGGTPSAASRKRKRPDRRGKLRTSLQRSRR